MWGVSSIKHLHLVLHESIPLEAGCNRAEMCVVPQKWGKRLWNSAKRGLNRGFPNVAGRRICPRFDGTGRGAEGARARKCGEWWILGKSGGVIEDAGLAQRTKGVCTGFALDCCVKAGNVVQRTEQLGGVMR